MSGQHKTIKVKDSQSKAGATNNRIEGKMNYDQGSDASLIMFSLVCEYLPVGTVVGFNSDKPGPNPPIELKPITVSHYPSFMVGIECDVPANYTCVITYYADLQQEPPPEARISLRASYPMHG